MNIPSSSELNKLIEVYADQLDVVLVSVNVDADQTHLRVVFADGYRTTVPLGNIASPRALDWNHLVLQSAFMVRIRFADGQGDYYLPSQDLRAVTERGRAQRHNAMQVEQALHISKNLRQHRESLGLSQQQLADRAGVSTDTINRIESGRPGSGWDVLEGFVHIIGIAFCLLTD